MTRFHVIYRSKQGRSFNLDKELVSVGRSPDRDIVIDDTSVSRSHLEILKKEGKYFIRDLQSTNGSFVNGQQMNPDVEFEVGEGVPVVVGKAMISIGEEFKGDVSGIFDAIDSLKKAGRTAMVPGKGRPMTSRNNAEFIYKVSRILGEPRPINESLELILNLIFDLLKRIDRGLIILIDIETEKTLDMITRFKRDTDDTIMMCSQTVVRQVIREGKPFMIKNAFAQEDLDLSESLRVLKVGSVMCVPLINKTKVWGAIYLDSIERPFGFREEDLHLMSAVGVTAALAVENDWLYARQQKPG